MMFRGSSPWLGQVPLVLGPSSWGAGMASLVLFPDPGPVGPIGPPYDEWWKHFGRDAGISYNPPGSRRCRDEGPHDPGRALREGEEIPANGGRILKRFGFLWFFPDPETMDKIEALSGRRSSESVEARVTSCIPLPPIAPTLGAFFDPETGSYCDIDLPDEWRCAWGEWWHCSPERRPRFTPTPPFYVKYAGPGTGDEFRHVGPFEDPEEAFDYAVERYGGLAPSVGHIEVYDSEGRTAIIT